MTDILKEAARLHALGASLIWLHPRSKRPVEKGWTKTPTKTWAELNEQYAAGSSSMNLGLRLGHALAPGKFLAVVDCDMKSPDPRHLEEMFDHLRRYFPVSELEASAKVTSGRRQGSAHYYVVTPEPVAPKRLAQSGELVRVHMPSAKPSPQEKELLTALELKEGTRLRAAWEISLMGVGQQVVVPPSIHPDTGRRYVWVRPWNALTDLYTICIHSYTEAPSAAAVDTDSALSHFDAVDILGIGLDDSTIRLILSGERSDGTPCLDRSAALLGACNALVKLGLGDLEILSLLTEPDTFLGCVAYEHAKTEDRSVAAAWVRKYTLVKSRLGNDAALDFQEEIAPSAPLSSDAEGQQKVELIGEFHDWKAGMDRTQNGQIKNTQRNLGLILLNEVSFQLFRKNEFSFARTYGATAPWRGGILGKKVGDDDVLEVIHWLAGRYRLEPSKDKVADIICFIANQNSFHPVRDYLSALRWDGTPRIGTWLKTYLKAEAPEPYLTEISRKFLCAMVARVVRPGVKFDQLLILEGRQGVGKSTAADILGGNWFSDSPIDLRNNQSAVLTLQGNWVMELGELSALSRSEVNQVKEFISHRVDHTRVPYGRAVEEYPRQSVFIGTTNNHDYSKDATGNRRIWPVHVHGCLFDELKRDRDQLFAEAYTHYLLSGENLYLDESDSQHQAIEEQAHRLEEEPMLEQIEKYVFPLARVHLPKLITEVFGGEIDPLHKGYQKRVADCLKRLNFRSCMGREKDGHRRRIWVRVTS